MTNRNSQSSELTVSMPAYNSSDYIGEAIRSVLDQKNVNLQLIVVDDCSTDGTVDVVKSFDDPRLKLICNEQRKGIGYCHNVVLRMSSSPYISHVDSDDFILPGALEAMLIEMKNNPDAGQSHCYFFPVDENGKASRKEFRRRKTNYQRICKPTINYRYQLLKSGWVINHLRTYRRKAIEEVGMFNEQLDFGIDYEMALRIIDKYDIFLVQDIFYLYRKHKTNTTRLDNSKKLRMYIQKNEYYGRL